MRHGAQEMCTSPTRTFAHLCCTWPVQVSIGIDPKEVFSGADWALMVGAKPRGPGMERADLLNQNGEIFKVQVSFCVK